MINTRRLRKECNDIMNEKIVDFNALRAELRDVLKPDNELTCLREDIKRFVSDTQ